MTTKKRENYQDFHERMEKKRMRVKRVRKWRAWAWLRAGRLDGVTLTKKPMYRGWEDGVVVPVEIREVRR